MKKSFKINDEWYVLDASLFTFISYKKLFGTDLLNDLEKAEKMLNSGYDERCDGCIIYLQALYVLIAEGNSDPELPLFVDWVAGFNKIKLPEIVKIITDLYTQTTRPDRKNRTANTHIDEFASGMSIEELADMLLEMGVSIADFHDITFGMALNMLWEHSRSLRRRRGEKVEDPERTYKIMKANLPALTELHDAGKISDEEYNGYINRIKLWESDD